MTRGLPLLLALLGCLSCSDGRVADAGAGGDEVAVRVEGIALDDEADAPVVILVETDGERRLPIWIGLPEAHSIAAHLDDRPAPRPNTHDLAKRLIEGLDGNVRRIVVTDLRDGIYYARIELEHDGHSVAVDARPSDAIAIGLRLGAPLFVRAALFEAGPLAPGAPGREIRGAPSERQVRAQRL
jgi:bifunctional DNase/RNase